MPQRTKNIATKYLKRTYLWNRRKLKSGHRISEWRTGGQVTKVYEKLTKDGWYPIKVVKYEVSD